MMYFRVWVTPHNLLGQFLYVMANQWPGKWDDNQGYVASLYRRIKGWWPDVFLQLMPLMPPFGDFSYSMQSILDKWRQNKSQILICRVKPSICGSYIWVNHQFFFWQGDLQSTPWHQWLHFLYVFQWVYSFAFNPEESSVVLIYLITQNRWHFFLDELMVPSS